ncbi:MAG: hypothetical protein EHM65_07820, partial [Acidobacteriales bacterium]
MSSLLKISVSILLLFLSVTVTGNPYRFSAGAAEAGMGSLCITRNSFWSQFSNQALQGHNNSFAAGINYENRFGISELGTRTAGIIIPAGRTSLGFVYSNFGYPDFRRKSGGISCGMALSDKISGGVQIDYFSEKTSGESDVRKTITCEAGMLIVVSEKVRAGVHIFNPVPNSLRKSFLPSSIRAGAGIELSKVLYAGMEAEMSTMEKLIVRTGFEYEAFTKIWLRGGFSSENASFTFGTGYLFK